MRFLLSLQSRELLLPECRYWSLSLLHLECDVLECCLYRQDDQVVALEVVVSVRVGDHNVPELSDCLVVEENVDGCLTVPVESVFVDGKTLLT